MQNFIFQLQWPISYCCETES